MLLNAVWCFVHANPAYIHAVSWQVNKINTEAHESQQQIARALY